MKNEVELTDELMEVVKFTKPYTDMFKEYDRTGVWPPKKKKVILTLKAITFNRLQQLSEQTGKSKSRLIDELLDCVELKSPQQPKQ